MRCGSNSPEILHLVEYQKFIPPFIELVEQELDFKRHHFYFVHNGHQYNVNSKAKLTKNAKSENFIKFIWHLAIEAWSAEKIVIHGLFSSRLILALVLQPWIWKKCYWVIWGGDLYTHVLDVRTWRWHVKELFRRILIPKLGHLLTYIPGDVKLARQWYGAKGIYHECIMYPSNTYQSTPVILRKNSKLNILIGNSADSSNNHAEIIDKIKKLKCSSVKIIAPLSYGEKEYARQIAELGEREFGENFIAITNFMSHEEYLKILAGVDIAVFNHRRQQGMGNIISLLGMGKTVAIRSDVSTWEFLSDMGIVLRDTLNLDISMLSAAVIDSNVKIIQEKFTCKLLASQYRNILEY
jgi:hypothetical protein